MDWQQITALSLVALTAAWMVRSRLRRRLVRGKGRGTCPGCGGGASGPQETVILHARRGERPEIRIRPRQTP